MKTTRSLGELAPAARIEKDIINYKSYKYLSSNLMIDLILNILSTLYLLIV